MRAATVLFLAFGALVAIALHSHAGEPARDRGLSSRQHAALSKACAIARGGGNVLREMDGYALEALYDLEAQDPRPWPSKAWGMLAPSGDAKGLAKAKDFIAQFGRTQSLVDFLAACGWSHATAESFSNYQVSTLVASVVNTILEKGLDAAHARADEVDAILMGEKK